MSFSFFFKYSLDGARKVSGDIFLFFFFEPLNDLFVTFFRQQITGNSTGPYFVNRRADTI